MVNDCSIYRLEELLSSFYKIETIEKINYHQYVPKKQDDQWSIQMELYLRRQNPRNLVALLSRELWCFSINDDPVPTPPKLSAAGNDVTTLDKSGQFTAQYSKPNLPPHYALFLKALRRMIYINLAANSQNKIVPYGNACLFVEEARESQVLQLEPHLFENGDLSLIISTRNIVLVPLTPSHIEETFLRSHALYLSPSGIRIYLPSSNRQQCIVPPPRNADVLFKTLLVSHGIDLSARPNVQWVRVIPHLGHLNGYTPNVAAYMDAPTETRTIVWPLDLCFAQPASDVDEKSQDEPSGHDLVKAFDIIDDFIQLKQTSAYRTPTSSSGAVGNSLGTNPLSSGRAYTEQFQHFYKNMGGNPASNSYLPANENLNLKPSPQESSPSVSTFEKPLHSSNDKISIDACLTTPNVNENEYNYRRSFTNDPEISPTKSDLALTSRRDEHRRTSIIKPPASTELSPKADGHVSDVITDDLFGDGEEEAGSDDFDLFGESKTSPSSGRTQNFTPEKVESDEITEDMFGMSDDEDRSRSATSKIKDYYLGDDTDMFRSSPSKRPPMKRKYLDIPIEEITLSASPLYMDPGAPLPVETPRDRRKSVFAPLNFNPIIENNVDNKYKNGGKFSFSPSQHEGSLKFDVSTADISSSGDESDSSADLDDLNIKSEVMSSDNLPINSQYNIYSSAQIPLDSIATTLNKSDIAPSSISSSIERDSSNTIWRLSHQELANGDSSLISSNDTMPSEQATLKSELHTDQFTFSNKTMTTGGSNTSNLPESNSGVPESTPATGSLVPESSSSLPFLLRHMPLSSIPATFWCSNPTVTIKKNDQCILNLLSEQIVFDHNMFSSISKPLIRHAGLEKCNEGLISKTIRDLFKEFTRLDGSHLISTLYPIKEPSVYVKKHNSVINISADSQAFSKFLNVRPAKGIKNFRLLMLTASYCDDCSSFVSTLYQTYTGHEFGFCELLKLTNDDSPGLRCLENFDKGRLFLLAAQIVTYCSTNKNAVRDVPVVILLPVDSYNFEELVLKVAKFDIIRNEVTSKIPDAQIFLKVVPISFIRNPLSSVDDYSDLCVAIYNLLPPKNVKFTSIARKLPEKVTFKTLQQKIGTSAISYDAFIHLAYARSVDKEWVFAALSDSSGNESMIKSWYVGMSKTKFDEACNEIWTLALRLSSKKFGRICLILTRLNGVLPDDELMNWRRLSGKTIHLAVVCVDNDTKISFFDEDKIYPTFKPLLRNGEFSKKIDLKRLDSYEIRDISQDIHAVIFEGCFPLTNSQHRCAIKSGALIKFKTSAWDSIVDKFEVNLLNCPHSDSTKLLKTILEEFRNLGALSSWFGVSNGELAHIPWHVLAVKKMMQVMIHTRVKTVD